MSQKTIVICEDDRSILESLQQLLEFEGYDVVATRNGKELLEALPRVEHPHLILLDLMMPIMDGRETLRELKRSTDPAIARIPVIVLSAGGMLEDLVERGATAYLKKPFETDQILEMIARYVR